jgi:hypothetical protein
VVAQFRDNYLFHQLPCATSGRSSSADDSINDGHELVLASELQREAKLQDPKVFSALASYSSKDSDGQAQGRNGKS